MDEIERMVEETYEHYQEKFSLEELQDGELGMREEYREEMPDTPGIIYHIQKTSSIFVIRTFVSRNIRADYQHIMGRPEEFPSLRLLEGGNEEVSEKLRFFLVENPHQAEIIHDQLNNRRFPVYEETLCNLSDPGFSWWLTPKGRGFQISFTLSISSADAPVKLGPLGDQQVALKNFQALESIINTSGLALSMQNEMNRVQFEDGEDFLMEELRDIFEYGVVSDGMEHLFRLLAKSGKNLSLLESTWFYLQELAAMRRFWIQVQYDITSQC